MDKGSGWMSARTDRRRRPAHGARMGVQAGVEAGQGLAEHVAGQGTALDRAQKGGQVLHRPALDGGQALAPVGLAVRLEAGGHVPALGLQVEQHQLVGADLVLDRGNLGRRVLGRGEALDDLLVLAHGGGSRGVELAIGLLGAPGLVLRPYGCRRLGDGGVEQRRRDAGGSLKGGFALDGRAAAALRA